MLRIFFLVLDFYSKRSLLGANRSYFLLCKSKIIVQYAVGEVKYVCEYVISLTAVSKNVFRA